MMKLLLDLDDVLNDFTSTALSYFCGFEVHKEDYPVPGSFDIVHAASILTNRLVTKPEFWDTFSRDFWATVPKSAEFNMIMDFAESFGRENVCILTAPTIDPMCLAGKLDWIHEHAPSWLHRQYLVGPRKHFCAAPDRMLIDDSDRNVRNFREHGGNALLVPRPWNSKHDVNDVHYLGLVFESFRPVVAFA